MDSLSSPTKREKLLAKQPSAMLIFCEQPLQKERAPYIFLNVDFYSPFKGGLDDPLAAKLCSSSGEQLEYKSCLHYYDSHKLLAFEEVEEAKKVLQANEPAEVHKITERTLAKHQGDPRCLDWDKQNLPVMQKAVRLKFEQNATLRDSLLTTAPKELHLSSPTDSFWSVCPLMWRRGKSFPNSPNVLGNILMDLRDNIIVKNPVVPVGTEGEQDDNDCVMEEPGV